MLIARGNQMGACFHCARQHLVIIGILTIGVMGTLIDLVFFALTQRLIPWKVGESTDYGRG